MHVVSTPAYTVHTQFDMQQLNQSNHSPDLQLSCFVVKFMASAANAREKRYVSVKLIQQ